MTPELTLVSDRFVASKKSLGGQGAAGPLGLFRKSTLGVADKLQPAKRPRCILAPHFLAETGLCGNMF